MGIMAENKVRQTLRMTDRHEKKGVKRRRLASQTHRRKFAQMVSVISNPLISPLTFFLADP